MSTVALLDQVLVSPNALGSGLLRKPHGHGFPSCILRLAATQLGAAILTTHCCPGPPHKSQWMRLPALVPPSGCTPSRHPLLGLDQRQIPAEAFQEQRAQPALAKHHHCWLIQSFFFCFSFPGRMTLGRLFSTLPLIACFGALPESRPMGGWNADTTTNTHYE